jgi:hypothetical protein
MMKIQIIWTNTISAQFIESITGQDTTQTVVNIKQL